MTSYFADGLVAETQEQNYTYDQGGTTVEVKPKTTYTYDANGNVKTTTDGIGAVTTNTWTSDNLIASIQAPGQTGGTFNTTEYGYDKAGNPTSVKMPQQVQDGGKAVINEFTDDDLLAATHTPISDTSYRSVRYAYSMAGRKVATETARCTNGTVANCTTDSTSWQSAGLMRLTYGANGRVADEIGRSRKSISTTYDASGGPKKVRDPISGITIDAFYYLDGTVRTVDDGRNENTFAYDAAGQPTIRTDKTPTPGVTAGSKITTSYNYNAAGLVKNMTSGVLNKSTSYDWDQVGRLRTEDTDGHINTWSWNPDGSLAGVETKAGGATKATFAYRYDNNGNITRQVATGDKAYVNSYTYGTAAPVGDSWG